MICHTVLALTLLTVTASQATAQGVEITPYAGWQVFGRLALVNGDLELPSEANFGVIVGFPVQFGTDIELVYNRQNTAVRFDPTAPGAKEKLFDAAVEYYHIGGLREGLPGRRFTPFGTASAGATHFNPADDRGSEWRFSMALGLGGKSRVSERVGVRFQTRLWFTYLPQSSGAFCTPGGCVAGVAGNLVSQVDFSGGVVIRLGR